MLSMLPMMPKAAKGRVPTPDIAIPLAEDDDAEYVANDAQGSQGQGAHP